MSTKLYFLVAAATLLLTAASCGSRSSLSVDATPALLLRDVRVVDVVQGRVSAPTDLRIEEGRIAAMGSDLSSSNASVRELDGHYVIPGLIDSHVHSTAGPEEAMVSALQRTLRGGVTRVRDMGGDGIVIRERNTRARELSIPTVHFATVVAGPSWMTQDSRAEASAHGETPGTQAWLASADGSTDVRALVHSAQQFRVDALKLYADMDPETVRALTTAAQEEGLGVWGHAAIFPTSPMDAVRANVEVLSHAESLLFASDSTLPERYHDVRWGGRGSIDLDDDAFQDLLSAMSDQGTFLDATLTVSAIRAARGLADANHLAAVYDITRRAHEAGVRVLAGTDAMMLLGNPLPSLHGELELLVSNAGLSPADALRSATVHAATMLGVGEDVGHIDVGLRADLVVLQEDPLQDIRATRGISLVVNNGVVVPDAP
ncbi:MAG: amidohydrolase family protein [Bacteroidota bacterium]